MYSISKNHHSDSGSLSTFSMFASIGSRKLRQKDNSCSHRANNMSPKRASTKIPTCHRPSTAQRCFLAPNAVSRPKCIRSYTKNLLPSAAMTSKRLTTIMPAHSRRYSIKAQFGKTPRLIRESLVAASTQAETDTLLRRSFSRTTSTRLRIVLSSEILTDSQRQIISLLSVRNEVFGDLRNA